MLTKAEIIKTLKTQYPKPLYRICVSDNHISVWRNSDTASRPVITITEWSK